MFFNTIEEYNDELDDIKSTLDSMEKRLDEEPFSTIRFSISCLTWLNAKKMI